MASGEIPVDLIVKPREAHDWVDRSGRAWSWALAEIVLPDLLRAAGLRVTIR